uniref:Uncharacterized protein n=1 Tax=Oryza nivara TaxID=4536 RepID=A0A0E0J6V4_ORYNI
MTTSISFAESGEAHTKIYGSASNLCFVPRWGLPAYQVECTSNESLGSSCHGIAVAPCQSAPFLLLSFIGKSTPLVQLNSHFNRVALCFQILSVMYWGLSPKL